MSNQTIDGVLISRQLAERLTECWNGTDARIELRALLDADQRPEGCCCPPKGYTGLWAGAMCPIHFGLRAITKAAQPQGDPVAYLDLEKIQPGGMAYATKMRVNHRQTALYAEHPASVIKS